MSAHVWHKGVKVVAIVVSDDPSGPGGAMEEHASISASTMAKRRMPSPTEVQHAIAELGWAADDLAVDWNEDQLVVHVYRRGGPR